MKKHDDIAYKCFLPNYFDGILWCLQCTNIACIHELLPEEYFNNTFIYFLSAHLRLLISPKWDDKWVAYLKHYFNNFVVLSKVDILSVNLMMSIILRQGTSHRFWQTFNIFLLCFPIVDTTEPTITGCPEDIIESVELGIQTSAVFWTEPTATDASGVVQVSSRSHTPGMNFPVDELTTVIYEFSDNSGNVARCIFTVFVTSGTNQLKKLSGIEKFLMSICSFKGSQRSNHVNFWVMREP